MQKLGATPAVVDNDRQSRRSFLRDAGGMLAAGAASLPGIGERLAAQEPPSTSIIDAPAEVVTIPPDPRYYNEDGFNLVEELQYTPGPSLINKIARYDFIAVLMKKFKSLNEWDQKTFTAPVPADNKEQFDFNKGLGYLNDLDYLAWASLVKAGSPLPGYLERSPISPLILLKKFRDGDRTIKLSELEKFAEVIKSGRLASLISCATLAGYPITDQSLAKKAVTAEGEIKLSLVAEAVNKRLGDKYNIITQPFIVDRVDPRARAQRMENAVLESLYGKANASILIKSMKNSNPGREKEAHPNFDWMTSFAKEQFNN